MNMEDYKEIVTATKLKIIVGIFKSLEPMEDPNKTRILSIIANMELIVDDLAEKLHD